MTLPTYFLTDSEFDNLFRAITEKRKNKAWKREISTRTATRLVLSAEIPVNNLATVRSDH